MVSILVRNLYAQRIDDKQAKIPRVAGLPNCSGRLRRARPCHGHAACDPGPGRMARTQGLDGDPSRLWRRISRQRCTSRQLSARSCRRAEVGVSAKREWIETRLSILVPALVQITGATFGL